MCMDESRTPGMYGLVWPACIWLYSLENTPLLRALVFVICETPPFPYTHTCILTRHTYKCNETRILYMRRDLTDLYIRLDSILRRHDFHWRFYLSYLTWLIHAWHNTTQVLSVAYCNLDDEVLLRALVLAICDSSLRELTLRACLSSAMQVCVRVCVRERVYVSVCVTIKEIQTQTPVRTIHTTKHTQQIARYTTFFPRTHTQYLAYYIHTLRPTPPPHTHSTPHTSTTTYNADTNHATHTTSCTYHLPRPATQTHTTPRKLNIVLLVVAVSSHSTFHISTTMHKTDTYYATSATFCYTPTTYHLPWPATQTHTTPRILHFVSGCRSMTLYIPPLPQPTPQTHTTPHVLHHVTILPRTTYLDLQHRHTPCHTYCILFAVAVAWHTWIWLATPSVTTALHC